LSESATELVPEAKPIATSICVSTNISEGVKDIADSTELCPELPLIDEPVTDHPMLAYEFPGPKLLKIMPARAGITANNSKAPLTITGSMDRR
jgi:hypothetical protein